MISLNNSGVIKAEDVLEFAKNSTFKSTKALLDDYHYALIKKIGLKEFLDQFTQEVVAKALEENDNKARQAIKELGISSATFYRYADKKDEMMQAPVRKAEELQNELH